MNKNFKYFLFLFLGIIIILFIFNRENMPGQETPEKITYSRFKKMLTPDGQERYGRIYTREVTSDSASGTDDAFILQIGPRKITGRYVKPGVEIKLSDGIPRMKEKTIPFEVESVPGLLDDGLIEKLDRNNITYKVVNPEESSILNTIFQMLPFVLIIALLWLFMMRQIQSTGNRAMSFGKSKARLHAEGKTRVTFLDVAGCDEAKEELVFGALIQDLLGDVFRGGLRFVQKLQADRIGGVGSQGTRGDGGCIATFSIRIAKLEDDR